MSGNATTASASLSESVAGGDGGIDYRANPDLLWGFAAGASTGSFSEPDRSTSGKVDGGHVSLYGVARSGPLYLFSDLAYAHYTNQTNRIASTGILPTEVETGHFGSNLVSGRIETDWRHFYGSFGVTPFAALDFFHLWQPAYSENSATTAGAPGLLGLSYASEQVTSLPFSLGAQLDYKTALPNEMTWSQYVRGSWVYELASTARAITPAFEVAPTVPFAIDGAAKSRNAARVDAGTTLKLSARAELFGNFTGEFSTGGQSYAGTGGLRVS